MTENEEAKYTNEEKTNEECGFVFSSFIKIIDEDTGEQIMSIRTD